MTGHRVKKFLEEKAQNQKISFALLSYRRRETKLKQPPTSYLRAVHHPGNHFIARTCRVYAQTAALKQKTYGGESRELASIKRKSKERGQIKTIRANAILGLLIIRSAAVLVLPPPRS